MRYIPLGKTGLTAPEVGFVGIPIIRLDEDTAATVLRRAYELGTTLYDTANAYCTSEKKIGRALGDVRNNVVIATKTTRRDAPSAIEQLENSLHMVAYRFRSGKRTDGFLAIDSRKDRSVQNPFREKR